MAGALAVLTANSLEANGAYWVSGDRLSDLMDLMYNNKHVSPVEYRAAPSTHQHREDRPGPPERHLDSKGAKGAVRLCPRRKKSRTLSPREIIIDANYLSTFFHLPQPEAAVKMGISLSALKSVCRRVGVPRWPYKRQYTTNDSPCEEEEEEEREEMEIHDAWEEEMIDEFELFEEALRHVEGRAFKRRRS